MKKIYFILICFIFLTGCAQNLALLGPAFTVVKTGSIQQVFVGESINQGIKKEAGKNVTEHVMQFLDKDIKEQECKYTNGDTLQEIFFNTFGETNCQKTQ